MTDNTLELTKLKQLVEDGKNAMLFGPEDPESLQKVMSYIRQIHDSHHTVVFVEVSTHWDALDFANNLSSSIFKSLQPGIAQRPTSLPYQTILEDTLTWADQRCEEAPMVVVLGEFHHVDGIPGGKVDAALRSVMQRLKNVSFIFMSTQKAELSKMFILKSQPLYGMASTVTFKC